MPDANELRMQPQDTLAEQAVLGSIFLNPDSLIEVREFVEPDDFYRYAHQVIFRAMIN